MTQEDKELLLKDLSARLPYGVKICYTEFEYKTKSVWDVDYIYKKDIIVCKHPYARHKIENCLLYLRPLTSMTEEEKAGLFQLMGNGTDIQRIDFYLSHYFDFRCLIPMGLAIEAPKGMYNITK